MRRELLVLVSIALLSFALVPTLILVPTSSSQTSDLGGIASQRPMILKFAGFGDPGFKGFYSFQALQYPHPNATPITITVANDVVFNDTGLTPYNATVYVPPGNYSLILLNVSVNETGGNQFDRTIYIYANNITVFWGSTQEILNSTAEVDLTLLENFLKGNVTFKIVLPNYYDKQLNVTGVYEVTVKLLLYPGKAPSNLPTYVIPLFYNKSLTYPMAVLNPSQPNVTQAVSFPKGTYNAMLVLYVKGGGYDEFWYASLPAIRNFLVYYNGFLAGVIQPYPVVYTGGINPFWWKPVTSINTLAFHTPQLIPLTPLLALGNEGNLTVVVSNLVESSNILQSQDLSWDVSGYILVWNMSSSLINATFLKAYSYYYDSGPVIGSLGSGYSYSEGAKYLIDYQTLLKFPKGYVIASYTSWGSTEADQSFNVEHEIASLEELSYVNYSSGGLFAFNYTSSIKNSLSLDISAFAAQISSATSPPINYSYIQNGTLHIYTQYESSMRAPGLIVQTDLNESLETLGGFGGKITVINSYGGAVLDTLYNNYAVTTKTLKALLNVNGYVANETVRLVGLQNSTVNLTGFYKASEVQVSTTYSSPGSPQNSIMAILINVILRLIELFIF
ncbi:MAG: peptide-N4-asparagine amidase [Sulfolobales archaeon]|nr:peptide-N4-asparagine amidase [Sulfolobales archaeon]